MEGKSTPTPHAVLGPATLPRRFGALFVDWVLASLAAGFVGPPQDHPWAPPLILLLEYGFFLGLFGQTPGMFVTRIRCARLATRPAPPDTTRRGTPGTAGPATPDTSATTGAIGVPRALLRGALLLLVVPALVMDADRRGLHDRAAGTMMVQCRT